MKKENCFYCTKNHELSAFHDHREELFELSEEEQKVFFKSLSEVASVLKKIFHADKINYAIYGDLVSHFHVHIVPKKKDGPEWGIPFTDTKEKIYLTNEEYLSRIKLIKSSL